MSHALAWVAGGTGFTFLMTTLGAAMVFFFEKGGQRQHPEAFSWICSRGDDCCVGLESADSCDGRGAGGRCCRMAACRRRLCAGPFAF